MIKKKIYISNLAWHSKDIKYIIEKIKKYELSGIDIAPLQLSKNWKDIDKKIKRYYLDLKAHNIKVNALQGIFYKTNLSLFEDQKNGFKNILNHIKFIIKLCKITHCNKIIIGSSQFRNPKKMSTKEADLVFYSFLKKIIKYLKKEKIFFCLEAIPKEYGEKYINDISHLIKIVKKVNSKWIKINFDTSIFHFNRLKTKIFLENINLIKNIQITEKNFNYLNNISNNNKKFCNIINKIKDINQISIEIIKKKTHLPSIDNSFKNIKDLF
jgi:sugar phosphate isomerase/epimerase